MTVKPDLYGRIVAAKVFIDNNYQDPISMELVSQQAFLSRFHFHRLFTRVYRKTPHQYLTYARMQAARQLLKEEGASISDVCNNVGFESAASFSLLFKKECGCTPQYYRNRALQKKKEAQQQPRKFIPHCHIQQFSLGRV